MGPKWVFIWVLYGQPIRDSWGICNRVPCWTHMDKAMWETCGNYMGPVWEKSTHISRNKKKTHKKKQNKKKQKNTFLHKWLCPQSQSIWWTGKVPNERGLCTRASYCTFVQSVDALRLYIGVFFNSWKWWLHAYLYIPLNFKSNRDIRVKIKTWPWIDVHVGKIVKINLIDTFIL